MGKPTGMGRSRTPSSAGVADTLAASGTDDTVAAELDDAVLAAGTEDTVLAHGGMAVGTIDTVAAPSSPGTEDTVAAPSSPGTEDTVAAPSSPGTENTLVADTPVPTMQGKPDHPGSRRSKRSSLGPTPRDAGDYAGLHIVEDAHYADRAVLTQGGMGRITTARDRRLRRKVAIKELLTQNPGLKARFEREAMLTARLQHPSIVSIYEAGLWPNYKPFYAMKLVPGRPFDQVLKEADTLDKRMALLPHVLAVADALAYAHKERVIHRDLKPQNVLVGEFGETVVIDWGLAKDLADTSNQADADAGPYRSRAADPSATQAGAVLGTPAYMPPEQALGESVDERADVYSIGALLYALLAGQPPYTGKSSLEILEAVEAGEPIPLAERQEGIAPDLLAIVARAMARKAENRYPTARELADDLRRFQSGQLVGAHQYSTRQLIARWLRRHKTAVTVAAIASVILAAFAVVSIRRIIVEQERAEAERVLAEQHRANAEGLLDFMLGDLHDRLEPVGKLDLLESVAHRASDYYQDSPVTSDEDRRRRSVVLRNIGSILSAQGDQVAALTQLEQSRALLLPLVEANPERSAWLVELATTHDNLAHVIASQGDQSAALAEFEKARALRDKLVRLEPTHADYRRGLATSYGYIGRVQAKQGDQQAALDTLRKGHAIRVELAAEHPDDSQFGRALVVSHRDIGNVLEKQGNLDGALTAHRQSLAIAEKLVESDATNAIWRQDLSDTHVRIGEVLLLQRDPEGALAAYRSALALRQRLAQDDPGNADRQIGLAVAHEKIGNALSFTGKHDEAMAEYTQGLAIESELSKRDPSNLELRHGVYVGTNKIANALLSRGDATASLQKFREALAIIDEIAAADPSNANWQRDLSVGHGMIGYVHESLGNVDGALAEYRAALTIQSKLAATDPTNANRKQDVIIAHSFIGNMLMRKGEHAAALTEYQQVVTIGKELVALDPGNGNRQYDLSVGHLKVGDVALETGDWRGALDHYRAAHAIRERLRAGDPDDFGWLIAVGATHHAIARSLVAGDELEQALVENQECVKVGNTMIEANPESTEGPSRLVICREQAGDIWQARGETGKARGEYAKALELAKKLSRGNPGDAQLSADVARLAGKGL